MKRNLFAIVLIMLTFIPSMIHAQGWGYKNYRIAISADGNNQADNLHKWPRADPDDWGATPTALAIIAKRNLQDKLVHFSYNNFIAAPAHTTERNEMKIGVDGAIQRWSFEASRFFDVSVDNNIAIEHLADELAKSTTTNPLYFIHMGPAEFFYRAIEKVIEAGKIKSLAHVYVISHSGYNDSHLRRGDAKYDKKPVLDNEKHHVLTEAIALSGNRIKYKKIKDQNGQWDPTLLWNSEKDWSVWEWMKNHHDKNIGWIYERMKAHSGGKADCSDAGLLYYLITGDEDGSPSKFKDFIGNGIVVGETKPVTGIRVEVEADILVFKGKHVIVHAAVIPESAWNKQISWKSENSNIAVAQNGKIYAKGLGKTQITASTLEGGFSKTFNVVVEKLPECIGEITLNALNDFTDLEINGFVPAYKDQSRGALAVDATKYKEKFAAASTTFTGEKGLYDITLTTKKETDGESTYRLRIGGKLVGKFQNPVTTTDMEVYTYTFKNVTVKKGERIQVEFNSTSNGKIPEGDAFAFARGRWSKIDFKCAKRNCMAAEVGGFLQMEAENIPLKGLWAVVDDASAGGGAYIHYTGVNYYSKPNHANTIEVKFKINNPGTYSVKWLMRQPQEAEGDKSNDAWINFPDVVQRAGGHEVKGFNKFVGRSKGNFGMNGQLDLHGEQPWLSVFFKKAGTYTLQLSGRSEFLQIDRIVLYKDMSFDKAQKKTSDSDATTDCDETEPVDSNNGFSTYKETVSKKLGAPIVIDGDFDTAWNAIEERQANFDTQGKTVSSEKDISYKFKIAYDAEFFYLIVAVKDDIRLMHPRNDKQLWFSDNVELFFNPDNVHETDGEYGLDGMQIRMNYGFTDSHYSGGGTWKGDDDKTGFEYISKDTELGYVIEGKIPWNGILGANYTLERSDKIGFDIAVGDSDATETRDNQISWANDTQNDVSYKDTRVFGHIIIESIDEEGTDDQTLTIDARKAHIKLFPNPVDDYLYFQGAQKNVLVNILSVNGSVLISRRVEGKKVEINIQKLPAGIYFAQIKSTQKSEIFKFIKN